MAFKISDISGAATEASQTVTPRASDLFEGDQATGTTSYKIDFPTLLAGYYLDASAQVKGFTTANVAEVDANTKALHVILRDADLGGGLNNLFQVSRYSIGFTCDFSLTTAGVTNIGIAQCFWELSGVTVINKINIAQCTGALSGTRNGTCGLRGFRGRMNALADRTVTLIPGTTSVQLGSLRTGQAPPEMVVTSMGTLNGGLGLDAGVLNLETNPIGALEGGAQSIAGSNDIFLSPLFDMAATGQPLVLLPFEGIHIDATLPAAGTSQSVYYVVNIQWEEWLPVASGNLL